MESFIDEGESGKHSLRETELGESNWLRVVLQEEKVSRIDNPSFL
jgi:hypothetical protein